MAFVDLALTGPAQVESASGEFAAEGMPAITASSSLPNCKVRRFQGRWTLNGQGSDQAVRDVQWSGQTLEEPRRHRRCPGRPP